ncbi:hypothetical protein [Chryseobacterium sp. A321]
MPEKAPAIEPIATQTIEKKPEASIEIPETSVKSPEPTVKIPATIKPLLQGKKLASRFSIEEALDPKQEVKQSEALVIEEELPTNHFSQSDVDTHWATFLLQLKKKDNLIYNAIAGFRLVKTGEDTIVVHHASQTARAEFERIQGDFFGPFKKQVHHHKIKVEYQRDKKLKKEIVTKRTLFEKMATENPVLKEMDAYFKFDLS